jgi:hypothetical protein
MNIGFEVSSFFLGTAFKRELYQCVQAALSILCWGKWHIGLKSLDLMT